MAKTITILGVGPAGLTAAIVLQKTGYQALVYEKNRDVGRVFYGDLQGLGNLSEDLDVLAEFEALGLAINFDCTPFSAAAGIIANFSMISTTSTSCTDSPILLLFIL